MFRVLEEELKTQQERLKAGTVGTLNVKQVSPAHLERFRVLQPPNLSEVAPACKN